MIYAAGAVTAGQTPLANLWIIHDFASLWVYSTRRKKQSDIEVVAESYSPKTCWVTPGVITAHRLLYGNSTGSEAEIESSLVREQVRQISVMKFISGYTIYSLRHDMSCDWQDGGTGWASVFFRRANSYVLSFWRSWHCWMIELKNIKYQWNREPISERELF